MRINRLGACQKQKHASDTRAGWGQSRPRAPARGVVCGDAGRDFCVIFFLWDNFGSCYDGWVARPRTKIGVPCRNGHPYERDQENKCAACRREWLVKNIERVRMRQARWRAKNRDAVRSYHRGWERARGSSRWKKFGVTLAEFNQMFLVQESKCAVCHTAAAKKWNLDHDHVTGRARGILCTTCNLGIGQMRDSADLCRAAAAYLDAHRLF